MFTFPGTPLPQEVFTCFAPTEALKLHEDSIKYYEVSSKGFPLILCY